MVKLLDFWATWCVDPQTPVLTDKGYIPASNIRPGQKLITVDPQTYKRELRSVQNTRVYKNTPSKKIVLETGRSLIGDINHKVLTEEGFKSLEESKIGQKVLIDPTQGFIPDNTDNEIILETASNHFSNKALGKLGLLPLKTTDHRLPILARLLGFVVTDGYLYEDIKHNIYETHFFAGQKEDAQSIKRDLQTLGFEKLEIKEQSKKRQIKGREFTMNGLRCRNLNRSLFFLLKSLGAPVGRKKNQSYFVPDWIMSGSLAIQREFLSGWIGGDGCKIDYYIKHAGLSSHYAGFKVNAIEFHKEKYLEREGILYAKQLGSLFEKQGVAVREISSRDDEDGVIISLSVSTDYVSLLNLATIGYSYAATKNAKVPFIGEFLKYRIREKERYKDIKKTVLAQLSMGLSSQTIASQLQIPLRTVVSWHYTNKDSETVNPTKAGQAIFTKWLEDRQQTKELLWEEIVKIEYTENRSVIGITVNAPHTIVTNGIVSHNCGPCKFMEPIVEELEKELAGKVEITKIDVDQNQEMASKYGVMSIPTYVVLKDDKEVGRIIGATSKENLLKALGI